MAGDLNARKPTLYILNWAACELLSFRKKINEGAIHPHAPYKM